MSSNCHLVLEGCMLVGGWLDGKGFFAFKYLGTLGVGPLDFFFGKILIVPKCGY